MGDTDTFSSDVMEDRGSTYTDLLHVAVVGVDSAKPEDRGSTYTDLLHVAVVGVDSAKPENKLECAPKYIIFLSHTMKNMNNCLIWVVFGYYKV
jgi:hypothetical protein